MKKFIAELLFGKIARKERARRNHNARVLQYLLNREHSIRDKYNLEHNTVFTTKKAIDMAWKDKETDYNRHLALKKATFKQYSINGNEKEDAPDAQLIALLSH